MNIKTVKDVAKANVITHSGVFHADEVLATVILSKLMEEVTVCRTFKVPEDISEDVIVYDIGFGKFDHHQKGGNGCRDNGVPYAAAGLVWKEFGHAIVENTCNPDLIWSLIDRDLIQCVDAADNGKMPKSDYPAQVYGIYNIVSSFNPNWNEQLDADEAFLSAVEFVKIVFDNILASAISKAEGQAIVDEAIAKSEDHIMVLDRFVPWQEFIFSSTNEKAEGILIVVFPSNRGGYNWQCVPDVLGGFGQRKPVPANWKGLNDEKLQKETGVPTATFCHPGGFIGGAKDFEGAMAIAKKAVEA